MPDFIPLHTFELSADTFGLFIINSDHVIFSTGRKSAAIFFVVNSQNIIVIFVCVKDLLSIFSYVLVNVSIGVWYKKDGTYGFAILIDRSPLDAVDGTVLFLLCWRVDIVEFFTCVDVEDFKFSVTVACSYELILDSKLCCH